MQKKVRDYIKKWTTTVYLNDLPDEAPRRLEELNKVPSYRQICIAILKNDKHLKTLGQSQPISKVYSQLKRKELEERGVIPKQWRLEL
jgi:predicted phosphoadenosine phosphosulfate sulfurtransferase